MSWRGHLVTQDQRVVGQIGYTLNATTDGNDWYRSFCRKADLSNSSWRVRQRAAVGNANLFATVYRTNAVNSLGSIARYSVVQGGTRRDTFRIFGRAPGDIIYVRLTQSSGAFDYGLSYTSLRADAAH